MEKSVSWDFETRSLVDIKHGAWRYAEDPSTDILCLAYAFPDEPPQLWWPHEDFPLRLRQWIEKDGLLRAWNSEFELAIYTRQLYKQHNLPRLAITQLRDTQIEAMAMSLPAALSEAGIGLELNDEHLKDPEGKRLIQYLCKPYKGVLREDPERLQRMGEYCKQDVVSERAIMRKLRRLPARELMLYHRTVQMNYKGLPVSRHRAAALAKRANEGKALGTEECKKITGGITPSQRAQLQDWANERMHPPLENLQKKTVERALQRFPEPREGVGRVLELRLEVSQTSLAKLNKLPQLLCLDQTLKGLFKMFAASTGRYASQGGFNAQNLPRGILTPDQVAAALLAIPGLPLKEVVSCLRSVFAFDMSVVDYSQIESRILLWLCGDEPGLDEFRQGLDPYRTMAARIYGRHYDDIAKGSEERQVGKATVLGAGFQLGPVGFVSYCDNMDLPIEQEAAAVAINTFRAKYSRVTSGWKRMQNAAVRAITKPGQVYAANRCGLFVRSGYLWMQLPSERLICWKSPWLSPGREDWMGPQINYMGRDRYTRKWTKCQTYGGSLVQSATQGTALDVMADAMLRMWDAGVDIRGTVHDEVIAKGDVQEQMEEIMLVPPPWARDLPIEVEGWTGEFYRK